MHVRWGVIGAGGIAARRTIPEAILVAPNSRLVAVMDQDLSIAHGVAAKYSVPHCFASEQDLLACPDVDAVYIATPAFLHHDQVIAAAHAHKPILCEKPLATSVKAACNIVRICREAAVPLAVGHMMRFHGAHVQIKQLLDAGALGQIVSARALMTCWYPPIAGAWRQRPVTGGGGALMDMGVHCADLLLWLLGEPRTVTALVNCQVHDYEVEDSATLLMEFAGGAHAVVEAFFNIPDVAATSRLELSGTKGTVTAEGTLGQEDGGALYGCLVADSVGYDAQQARVADAQCQPLPFAKVNPYRAEVEQFAEYLLSGRGAFVSGAEAVRALTVIEAGYRAARERAFVSPMNDPALDPCLAPAAEREERSLPLA
jgi:predicted dehydrogenase